MRIAIICLCASVACFIGCKSVSTLTDQQASIIMDADGDTPMRLFQITNKSDSLLLRMRSADVEMNPNDEILNRFIDRLYATVRDSMSMGVGIAAPQVGILKNIIWVQRFDKDDFPFEVYLNPEIIEYSEEKQPCLEGCLSIPDRSDTTFTRSEMITVSYDKLDRTKVTEKVKGFTAVIFQHEIDHLNGILYLDHLEKEGSNTN